MNASSGVLERSQVKFRRGALALAVAVCCLIAAAVFHRQILWSMGAVLVNCGPPERADIVVTLAGDASGHRIFKAGDLVREGYAPKVLVSGAGIAYGVPQSTLEIDMAVRHGYPREIFIPMQQPALSTAEEAGYIAARLRSLGVHKYLLVTSFSHTARAGRLLRRTAPDLPFHMIGVNYPHWNDGYWWHEREGEKIWLEETTKTIADFFGI